MVEIRDGIPWILCLDVFKQMPNPSMHPLGVVLTVKNS